MSWSGWEEWLKMILMWQIWLPNINRWQRCHDGSFLATRNKMVLVWLCSKRPDNRPQRQQKNGVRSSKKFKMVRETQTHHIHTRTRVKTKIRTVKRTTQAGRRTDGPHTSYCGFHFLLTWLGAFAALCHMTITIYGVVMFGWYACSIKWFYNQEETINKE